MVLTAKMPRPLAYAVPPIGGEGAITLDTAEILPSMFSPRFKQTRPAGASTDRAEYGKCIKESNGILNINVAIALQGPGIMVGRVPGERHRKDITYM